MHLHRHDLGSLLAVAAAAGLGLVAVALLPGEMTIQWGPDGRPTTVAPTPIGAAMLPVLAAGLFVLLRGGTLESGLATRTAPLPALAIVVGVALLQGAVVALNLGVGIDPLVAVLPGVACVLAGTLFGRLAGLPGASR
jgi:hypothetical protein